MLHYWVWCLPGWNGTCLQKWWMMDKVRLFQLALTPRYCNNFQWMDNRLIWTQKHVRDEKIIQDQDWVGMATFTSTVIVHRMRQHCPLCLYQRHKLDERRNIFLIQGAFSKKKSIHVCIHTCESDKTQDRGDVTSSHMKLESTLAAKQEIGIVVGRKWKLVFVNPTRWGPGNPYVFPHRATDSYNLLLRYDSVLAVHG